MAKSQAKSAAKNAPKAKKVAKKSSAIIPADTVTATTTPLKEWFSSGEQCQFLADTEFSLWRMCCRLLPHIALQTSSASAFFSLVERSGVTSSGSEDVDAQLQADAHRQVYRTIRSTVAASCALGHRSCQAIWGPRGCGKHRILRLLAQDCARQQGTFVVQLDGSLLRGDEAAIRVIARQMLAFLQSPQSAELRAADWSMRTGTFDFGRLFHFETEMCGDSATATARKGGKKLMTASESDDDEGEEGEEETTFITTTMAHLPSGPASALPPLQQALLLMKRCNVNIVVCIRAAEQFGLWCDQLLYVLSGLMHDGDGQGGGMALVLSSSAPDLRQMEKRLSSRLTCETRFIPLLPWTPSSAMRAMLSIIADVAAVEKDQHALDEERKQATALAASLPPPTRRNKVESTLDSLRAQLAARQGSINTRRAALQPLIPDNLYAMSSACASTSDGSRRNNSKKRRREDGPDSHADADGAPDVNNSRPSLAANASITLELWGAMCLELMDQMGGASKSETQTRTCLSQHLRSATEKMQSCAPTASGVVTVVSDALSKLSCGALDGFGAGGRERLKTWLRSRQGQEVSWLWHGSRAAVTACPTALPKRTPLALCQHWTDVTAAGTPHTTATTPLPPDLYDLLDDDCKLVALGYTSRESFMVLFHMLLHRDAGVSSRAVSDLLEDVSSSLGTKAAAALDTDAYRVAIDQLCRWRLLQMRDGSQVVSVCGSAGRLRDFLSSVLQRREAWCEGVLGLDAKDYMRIRSLV